MSIFYPPQVRQKSGRRRRRRRCRRHCRHNNDVFTTKTVCHRRKSRVCDWYLEGKKLFLNLQSGNNTLKLFLLFQIMSSITQTSIVKTRQTDWWRHLLAISCTKRGIRFERGGVQYIAWNAENFYHKQAVCLLLTIDNYANTYLLNECILMYSLRHLMSLHLLIHTGKKFRLK